MTIRHAAAAILVPLLIAGAAVAQTGTTAPAGGNRGYSFKCGTPPSALDWSKELDAIKPLNPVFGGTLIVSLPPPAPADKRASCIQAMYEARIEAIRRTRLFDEVKVGYGEEAGLRPDVPGRGFAVWVENFALVAGFADGMRQSLMTAQPLDQWATRTLPNQLKAVRAAADPNSTNVAATAVGATSYYGYKGREYISFSDLRRAFQANEEKYAGAARAADPLGARLLVVIPPENFLVAKSSAMFHLGPLDPSGTFGKVAGSSFYFAHLGQAEAVRKSGLFREVTVREQEMSEAPPGKYDAILWIKGNEAKWNLSIAGLPQVTFPAPPATDPQAMIGAVADAVAQAREGSH